MIEPAPGQARRGGGPDGPTVEAHGLDPVKVLRLAACWEDGGTLLLVGCEPSPREEAERHPARD